MYKGLSAPFIHRPDRDHADHGRGASGRPRRLPSLPVAPLPQVDFPTITVGASLPGASPDTMASSVAQPLERQIAQIPGVSQMTSTSSLGATAITVQFDLNRNIDAAANDIQAAINAASGQLPKDLPSPPTYRKVNPSDTPILILSVSVGRRAGHRRRRRAGKHPRPAISQISRRLARARRRPADAGHPHPDRSGEARRKGPAARGRPRADRHRHGRQPQGRAHRSEADLHDPGQRPADLQAKDWNDVIIAYRNGAPVRVRDIGQAVAGPQDTTQAAWSNGKPSVFLVVFKIPGANVINTVEAIKSTLTTLQASIPPTIQVSILSDRTTTIRASVRDVEFTLALTIALVVMVIFVFLRSVLGDDHSQRHGAAGAARRLRAMWVAGYSLDNLSLMAFTIAVGFVVDDAIVMLENITRHIEEGEKPFQAALKGSARDRLHHHIDLRLADRRADSASDDERHHRPPVPRIRQSRSR